VPRAGLGPAAVTAAGAALADELGTDQLSMGVLAERLGVKAPSLYKHVDSLADLTHRIAVLATTELADALRDATAGRAGHDALTAAAQAWRSFVKERPGRYAAANNARARDLHDPLTAAAQRLLTSLTAVLRGYQLDPDRQIHALRMLRSTLQGFATLEAAGGFQYDTDIDTSFTWMITLLDHGLRAPPPVDDTPASTRPAASHGGEPTGGDPAPHHTIAGMQP